MDGKNEGWRDGGMEGWLCRPRGTRPCVAASVAFGRGLSGHLDLGIQMFMQTIISIASNQLAVMRAI